MRAILIDPAKREITEVEGKFDDIAEIYRTMKIDTFSIIPMRPNAMAFVDDNGHVVAGNPCFVFKAYSPDYPIAGPMLLCGMDGEHTVSLESGLEIKFIESLVQWLDVESTGEMAGAGPTPTGYSMGHPVVRPRAAT